jgi:DNA-binding LacI/PurR family transcriptional regulator
MSDVARAAGVSTMTVSNVVNGRPGASDETRLRVLAAVERLGYRVNATARRLRAGRSGAVGLLVPDLDIAYYSHLAARLSDAAEEHGYHVVLERTGATREGELAAVSPSRLDAYDGVVFSPVALDADDFRRARIELPCVLLGERPLPSEFAHVMMDNIGGGEAAVRHLVGCGARRIALIGGRRTVAYTDMASLRSIGYRRGHQAAGLDVDEDLVVEVGSFGMRDGYRSILRLHEEGVPFDAAFVLTDSAAMGVLRALADLGRAVPQDVQVVGFDNDTETEFTVPRLTTIDPDNDAMAREIIRLLLAQVGTGRRRVEPEMPVMAARLIARESTRGGPARAERSAVA